MGVATMPGRLTQRVVPLALALGIATTLTAASADAVDQSHDRSHATSTPLPALHAAPPNYASAGLIVAPVVLPLPRPAPDAVSAETVMQSLRTSTAAESGRGLLGSSVNSPDYTIARHSVIETMAEPGTRVVKGVPFDAWVVTVRGVTPVSFGGPIPHGMTCTFVGVMGIASGTWSLFFTTC